MAVPLTLSSVPAQTPYIQYVASTLQTIFPYPFEITQDSDLVVLLNGVAQPTDGGYTVSGQGTTVGGNVTFAPGLTAGTIVTFYRNVQISRITQLSQNGTFFSSNFNNEFNRIYLIMQQLQQSLLPGGNQAYALMIPNSNNPAPTTLLTKANYANKYLSFDSNGNPQPAILTSSGALTLSLVASLTGPQTPAEGSLGVIPAAEEYGEGDIRRYGATIASTDNHAAINTALLVSSAGGSAAFVPGGQWAITTTITVPVYSSMYGSGNASKIMCTACDGLTFGTAASYSNTEGPNNFFRDFQLIGSNATTSTSNGIYSNLAAGSGFIAGIRFENISIISFQVGARLRGFNTTKFDQVFMYNVAQGFAFIGQSVTTALIACSVIRGGMTATGGAGTAFGLSIDQYAGETTQAIHVSHCNFYNFDINVNIGLGFEIQIEHCDLSTAVLEGVKISSTNGGIWVRDCWIEMVGGVTGTIGVNVTSQAVDNFQKIHILNNNIICDTNYAGSIGVNVGYNQAGVQVCGNYIGGFDKGVAALVVTAGSGVVTIKDNTIGILTSDYSSSSFAIQVNSSSIDVEVGPNTIVQGIAGVGSTTATWASTAVASSTSNITVVAASSFPAGTWVQFDTTADGLVAGVSYYVKTSSGVTITVAAYPAGAAIVTSGAYSGVVMATPLQVTFNTGATPVGMTFFGRGAFILTLSDPAVSGVCLWVASGKMVALTPVQLTGSAGATSMSGTGLPAFLAPSVQKNAVCGIENNSAFSYGMVAISTAAALGFYINCGAAAFTNGGTKGLLPLDIIYSYS